MAARKNRARKGGGGGRALRVSVTRPVLSHKRQLRRLEKQLSYSHFSFFNKKTVVYSLTAQKNCFLNFLSGWKRITTPKNTKEI